MDLHDAPDKYWHCLVKLEGSKRASVVNDLSFLELNRTIVQPWLAGRAFTVAGTVVNPAAGVAEIRICHTQRPQQYFADVHNANMRAGGISDLATDRRALPFREGEDLTYDLLFSGRGVAAPDADTELVMRVCQRLPNAARILANRSRKDKPPFEIEDEYDVQDLLHATLRAYIKHSVQEDTLPKVAAVKSGRVDISIEDLGILIEVKFVRGPSDQKRIFEEYSQDLVLYPKWPPLKTLILLIYNSSDLKDPEAFEKLNAQVEVDGKRFDVRVVLA